ncbi:hypothetical protein HDV04_001341 [Boothiomyces sp. JEL0838]|nr:hypothetical protein HDV04_001341 [Boothiomyces sp. JEL0838]
MTLGQTNYCGAFKDYPVKELVGKRIRLTPINLEKDADQLFEIQLLNPDLFDYMPFGPFGDLESFKGFLKAILDRPSNLVYTMRLLESDLIIGMEGYLNSVPEHKVIEVGHIFIDPKYQGMGYGIESSILLIDYAFSLGMYRVEWKTHHLNTASQKLALKLGFTLEGVFRNHMIFKGSHRHTHWFSIVYQDYPELQKKYLHKISK